MRESSDPQPRRAFASLVATVVALVVFSGCGEPPDLRRPPETAPPRADATRGIAYVRDGVVVVRLPARAAAREIPVVDGEASAVAWGDAGTIVVAIGMSIWRASVDGGVSSRVAEIRDPSNDAIVRLDVRIDGSGVVAMSAATTGAERFANARFWSVSLVTGTVAEISRRNYDELAGLRPATTSESTTPVTSPTGRWELRVAGFETAVPGASERVVVAPAGGGRQVSVADIRSLPTSTTTRYTGIVDDAGWAAGGDVVLFVAETTCGETCSGALFAVDVDGANLRRLGDSVEEVPREWNGSEAVFSDFPTSTETVILSDVATGERVDLGTGRGPKWQPR